MSCASHRERPLPAESNAFLGAAFGADGRFGAWRRVTRDDLQNPDDTDRDEFLLQRLPDGGCHALPASRRRVAAPCARICPASTSSTRLRPGAAPAEDVGRSAADYYVDGLFLDTGIDAIPGQAERAGRRRRDPGPRRRRFRATREARGRRDLPGGRAAGRRAATACLFIPRLGLPFRIGDFVEVYPEVGWHETLYDTRRPGLRGAPPPHGPGRPAHAAAPALRRRAPTSWSRGSATPGRRHLGQSRTIRSSCRRTAVPQQRVRQLDLANVTLDRADRIGEFNGITFGVGNRIYGPGRRGRLAAARRLLRLSASSSSRTGLREHLRRRSRLSLRGRARRASTSASTPRRRSSRRRSRSSPTDDRAGHALRLGYRFLRDVPRFFEDFQFATIASTTSRRASSGSTRSASSGASPSPSSGR